MQAYISEITPLLSLKLPIVAFVLKSVEHSKYNPDELIIKAISFIDRKEYTAVAAPKDFKGERFDLRIQNEFGRHNYNIMGKADAQFDPIKCEFKP